MTIVVQEVEDKSELDDLEVQNNWRQDQLYEQKFLSGQFLSITVSISLGTAAVCRETV